MLGSGSIHDRINRFRGESTRERTLQTGRIAIAALVLFASLPLARIAQTSGFALDAYLLVPTSCVGYWLGLTSKNRSARIGWFIFASVVAFLLAAFPFWEWLLLDKILIEVQDYLRAELPEYYGFSETVGVFSMIILPWIASCFMGSGAARLARRFLGQELHQRETTFNFTLRGLLVAMVAIGGLTAWLGNHVVAWNSGNDLHQQQFTAFFEESFTTGKVKLLSEPIVVQEKSWQNRERVYYRVSAPIKKDGKETWAMWTYLCAEANPSAICNFGYDEARTESALQYPMPQYVNKYSSVVNGEPKTESWVKMVEAQTTAKRGSTLKFAANIGKWMEGKLEIKPSFAIVGVPTTKTAEESGIVSWEVPLAPKYRGSKIKYKIISRANNAYRGTSADGTISLTAPYK